MKPFASILDVELLSVSYLVEIDSDQYEALSSYDEFGDPNQPDYITDIELKKSEGKYFLYFSTNKSFLGQNTLNYFECLCDIYEVNKKRWAAENSLDALIVAITQSGVGSNGYGEETAYDATQRVMDELAKLGYQVVRNEE